MYPFSLAISISELIMFPFLSPALMIISQGISFPDRLRIPSFQIPSVEVRETL